MGSDLDVLRSSWLELSPAQQPAVEPLVGAATHARDHWLRSTNRSPPGEHGCPYGAGSRP